MTEEPLILSAATDEELIALFQDGNEEAFQFIVLKFKNRLMNFVYRYVGNRDDAEDIVQETFIKLYNNKNSYRPVAKFSTWLYTIAGNLARTRLRHRKVGVLFSIFRHNSPDERGEYEIQDVGPSVDEQVDQSIRSEIIQKALFSLDAVHREIIILSDIQELTYEEICQITGLKMGTVKSRLNRARAQLRFLLKNMEAGL